MSQTNQRQKTSVSFGSYPQTQVSDSLLIRTLNEKVGNLPTPQNPYQWTSYEFYYDVSKKDLSWYIDVVEGNQTYRGVYFAEYRSQATDSPYPCIDEAKYHKNKVYWFQFEPITWDVTCDDLLVSEKILDSREFFSNATSGSWSRTSFDGQKRNVFANNYYYSTVRGWLNAEFYQIAFTQEEKDQIASTVVDNSYASTVYSTDPDFVPKPPVFGTFARSGYAGLVSTFNVYCQDSVDKIFLLSYKEYKRYVGDNPKKKSVTDYAYCINQFADWAWWLRSPMNNVTYQVCVAKQEHLFSWKTSQLYGIVPALKLIHNE